MQGGGTVGCSHSMPATRTHSHLAFESRDKFTHGGNPTRVEAFFHILPLVTPNFGYTEGDQPDGRNVRLRGFVYEIRLSCFHLKTRSVRQGLPTSNRIQLRLVAMTISLHIFDRFL